MFVLTVALFLLMFTYVLIALVLFYIRYSKEAFVLEFVDFLKRKPSLFRKLQLFYFTVLLAIPSKVWILDFLTPFQTFFFCLLGIVCLHVFPLITFIVFGHFLFLSITII